MPVNNYNKPALSPVDILACLSSKGLLITDAHSAIRVLETVGYYRLHIYCRPFQDGNHNFAANTSFNDVYNLYLFDRNLRLLCLDAIERIEVALRASINNRIAVMCGPHFYMEAINFQKYIWFSRFSAIACNTEHKIIDHYKSKYDKPELPPIWTLTEVLSFGKISVLFCNLIENLRKQVATDFGYSEKLLVSWFPCLTDFRNKCAHHERLWNAVMLNHQPMRSKYLTEMNVQDKFYTRAVLIVALLKVIEPGEVWRDKLRLFLQSNSFVNIADMGFPAGWDQLQFWN